MALIPNEIKELRQIISNQGMDGSRKMELEEVGLAIALYSQVERREKNILLAMSMMAKYNKGDGVVRKLMASNMLGEYEAVSDESNLVLCEAQGKTITMDECLDYWGSQKCLGCEVGKTVKKRCLR